ncbi:MAG: hypothetical protein ACOCRX_08415 [Candidatus Woesearchaeota archaeon]
MAKRVDPNKMKSHLVVTVYAPDDFKEELIEIDKILKKNPGFNRSNLTCLLWRRFLLKNSDNEELKEKINNKLNGADQ